MCMVSAVLDYGRQHIPFENWTPTVWHDYAELLKRIEDLDRKLNQPDCHDPANAAWMREVERRLAALEKKAE